MRFPVVKWLSIVLLLLTLLWWSSFSAYGLPVVLFVGIAALVIGVQAIRDGQARWAVAFLFVTAYFGAAAAASLVNPVSPAIRLGSAGGALAIVFSMAVFGLSFFALKQPPQMSTSEARS